jgi:uncharacterized protein (TIGR02284 family)
MEMLLFLFVLIMPIMHPADQQPLQLINSLIGVNNNRIECFNFAASETDVSVLKILFNRLVETSYLCREELVKEVYKLGGVPEEGTVPYFEFFKAWVAVKSAITRNDHPAILDSCAYEEGVVLRIYENILRAGKEKINNYQDQMFHRQYEILRADKEKVNNLRGILSKAA